MIFELADFLFAYTILGMFGISSFSAVINPPQACILAVGAGVTKLKPSEGKPKVVTTVTVQISADRRVVDEATASTFLQVTSIINLSLS